MNLRILLLGNTGQLGWELQRTLLTKNNLVAMDYPEINMADPDNLVEILRRVKPNLILNATAYTNVDKAESETEIAMAINGTGPGILAEEARKINAGLIHYSTDYVFDGAKGRPYTEEDQPNPLNEYGRTKLLGEKAVQAAGGKYLIFRTSWVYSLRRPCFLTKVMEWARKNKTLRIVDDQISSPTWARTLSEATAQILAKGREHPLAYIEEQKGLYHLTGGGHCSRYEWAQFILDNETNKESQLVKELLPANSSDFPLPATRPLNTAMLCDKFERRFKINLPSWQSTLKLVLKK